jgi:hypothetical protein
MQIEFQNLTHEERLTNVRVNWERWKESHASAILQDSVLLVVHSGGAFEKSHSEEWLDIAQNGGGVLFVSGGPGGVQTRLREKTGLTQMPSRWHVLQTPISGANASEDLRVRLERFLQHSAGLAPFSELSFEELLYAPRLSENVLALYFWCLAREKLVASGGVEVPDALRDIANIAWSDVRKIGEQRGIDTPSRSVLSECLDLDQASCDEFAMWVRRELLKKLDCTLSI